MKMQTIKIESVFSIVEITDTFVLLKDEDQGKSVTNDAVNVIRWLQDNIEGGLGKRRIYYRDTDGRFDEICYRDFYFLGFKPCSSSQQEFFKV